MTKPLEPEVEVYEPKQAGRRRRYTVQQKFALLDEAERPGETISSVARRYSMASSQLFKWRRDRDEGALAGLGAGQEVVAASELKAAQHRIRELERMLGKKTMEAEILQEAVALAREKKLISRGPLLPKADGHSPE